MSLPNLTNRGGIQNPVLPRDGTQRGMLWRTRYGRNKLVGYDPRAPTGRPECNRTMDLAKFSSPKWANNHGGANGWPFRSCTFRGCCSAGASAVPFSDCSLRAIVGIEFSHAVRADSVSEFRPGMGLNINFQDLPLFVLILNSLAGRADR